MSSALSNQLTSAQKLLMQGALTGNSKKIIDGISRGADVNFFHNDLNPLYLAISKSKIQAVKTLILHGANPHLVSGRPPLSARDFVFHLLEDSLNKAIRHVSAELENPGRDPYYESVNETLEKRISELRSIQSILDTDPKEIKNIQKLSEEVSKVLAYTIQHDNSWATPFGDIGGDTLKGICNDIAEYAGEPQIPPPKNCIIL